MSEWLEPLQGLEIGEKLLWKYDEPRYIAFFLGSLILYNLFESYYNLDLLNIIQGYCIFGDGESKLSLLDLSTGDTIHLMPNTLIGKILYP